MFSDSLNLNKKDYYFLIITLILSIVLVAYYIVFTEKLGLFCSDVYVYLTNALFFVGKPIMIAEDDIWLSPVVCLLTALFYELGIHSTLSIMLVNGLLAIVGNVGMYLFLRYKFDSIYSLFGTVCYTTFSLYLVWLGNGTLDIPSVSLTIWAVLFAVIAIDKNPKYYIPFAIVMVLGFFIRYPVFLIAPPLLVYFIYKKRNGITRDEIKYIAIAVVAAIILLLLIILPLASLNEWNINFISEGSSMVTTHKDAIKDPAYNTNLFYYIENSLNFLSSSHTSFVKSNPYLEHPTVMSFVMLAIVIIGGLITIKDNLKTKISKKIGLITLILAAGSIISFLTIQSIYTIALIFLTCLMASFAVKKDKFSYNMMMLAWLLIYIAFYSYITFKVNRYFIPCLPVIAYFVTYGLYKIQSKIRINKNIIPVILIGILIFGGFYYSETIEETNQFNVAEETYEFIISEYPDWKDLKIGSATVRPFNWYFGENLEEYKSVQVEEIEKSNMDLYISNYKIPNLYDFKEVKTIGKYTIYERIK